MKIEDCECQNLQIQVKELSFCIILVPQNFKILNKPSIDQEIKLTRTLWYGLELKIIM